MRSATSADGAPSQVIEEFLWLKVAKLDTAANLPRLLRGDFQLGPLETVDRRRRIMARVF